MLSRQDFQAEAMAVQEIKKRVYTVSRLNQEAGRTLETGFGMIHLQGELSNLIKHSSGHYYFSLKDSRSQISAAMFKGNNRYLNFDPQSGDEVQVRGRLAIYAANGRFQIIVEHMEPAGTGKLQQQFEATKKKLYELGWFDEDKKQPIPQMPQRIGIITSPTGAAVRDVLRVLARRSPQTEVIVYPTVVQGAQAAPKIIETIAKAERRNEVDLLLLVRGGGSIEDLWAFNEEALAKAIFNCSLPLVSGIGHEIDTTISDYVADLRAPTPSAAAEMSTPDEQVMVDRVSNAQHSLQRLLRITLQQQRSILTSLNNRLQMRHPQRVLEDRGQRVDELEQRLVQAMATSSRHNELRLANLAARLNARSPTQQLISLRTQLASMSGRLSSSMAKELQLSKSRWQIASRALNTVSPLATLDRGFAIVKHDDKVISNASKLTAGDKISTQVASGLIKSTVDSIDK